MSKKYTPFKMKGSEHFGYGNQSPAKKLGKNIKQPSDPVYKFSGEGGKRKGISRASDYDKPGGKGR